MNEEGRGVLGLVISVERAHALNPAPSFLLLLSLSLFSSARSGSLYVIRTVPRSMALEFHNNSFLPCGVLLFAAARGLIACDVTDWDVVRRFTVRKDIY